MPYCPALPYGMLKKSAAITAGVNSVVEMGTTLLVVFVI